MTSEQERNRETIMKNDLSDGDNVATFMAGFQRAQMRSNVAPVIIVEPRAVDFSLETLKPDDQARLDSLLQKHFSHVGTPIKIRLNGLLTEQLIDNVEKINSEDRALVSPPNIVHS